MHTALDKTATNIETFKKAETHLSASLSQFLSSKGIIIVFAVHKTIDHD